MDVKKIVISACIMTMLYGGYSYYMQSQKTLTVKKTGNNVEICSTEANGGACTASTDCDSGNCSSDTCKACVKFGSSCDSDGQCCSSTKGKGAVQCYQGKCGEQVIIGVSSATGVAIGGGAYAATAKTAVEDGDDDTGMKFTPSETDYFDNLRDSDSDSDRGSYESDVSERKSDLDADVEGGIEENGPTGGQGAEEVNGPGPGTNNEEGADRAVGDAERTAEGRPPKVSVVE